MITPSQLTTAVWGTGYGSRRHLVDRTRAKVSFRVAYVPARCSTGLLLDFVDSVDVHRVRVGRRRPCSRCYGIAATEGIPTDLPALRERTA